MIVLYQMLSLTFLINASSFRFFLFALEFEANVQFMKCGETIGKVIAPVMIKGLKYCSILRDNQIVRMSDRSNIIFSLGFSADTSGKYVYVHTYIHLGPCPRGRINAIRSFSPKKKKQGNCVVRRV
jgi:hypothetical protein